MERKTIKITITGGEFIFSERNKKDIDYSRLHKKMMEQRFKFIQENIKDPELQTAMLMSEIEKVYSPQQISVFILSSKEEQFIMAYDSFKIANASIDYEQFKKLIVDDELGKVINMIYVLEGETVEEKNKEFNEYLNANPEMLLIDFVNQLPIAEQQKLAEIIYNASVKKKAV